MCSAEESLCNLRAPLPDTDNGSDDVKHISNPGQIARVTLFIRWQHWIDFSNRSTHNRFDWLPPFLVAFQQFEEQGCIRCMRIIDGFSYPAFCRSERVNGILPESHLYCSVGESCKEQHGCL